jgi:hypothetical protein
MQADSALVWTVTEHSRAGDTIVGVYGTLEQARDVVSSLVDGNYEDYGIEGHVIDQGKREPAPWQVSLARDGTHLGTTVFVGCSCGEDEAEYLRRSYISDGGASMSIIVFAPTPGVAISAAERYRLWLQENDLWTSHALQLQPLEAPASV